jgi:hypothetical protein
MYRYEIGVVGLKSEVCVCGDIGSGQTEFR